MIDAPPELMADVRAARGCVPEPPPKRVIREDAPDVSYSAVFLIACLFIVAVMA